MIAYRPDVDGLRAISILVVLMFHAGLGDWTGGYVGVDVFFVISGYLITSLIATEIAAGRFRPLAFYERRVRRLLAASIPVVLFATLFAWGFYTSDRFLDYAESLVAFSLYAANWYFYTASGYFAGDAATAPLLHTWSLAVEEQFYLVFPFVMILLSRRPVLMRPVLAAIAVASLAYSERLLRTGAEDLAFYSSLSRAFELMLGALLALSADVRARLAPASRLMRPLGLAMIFTAVFAYGPSTPFPGLAALMPAVGALLILAADPARRDPVLGVLEWAPVVYLGKVSYGLYLWHWPVLGAMRTLVFDHNDLHTFLALIASFGLAALSYHVIEQPVRRRVVLPRGRDMAGLLAAASLACLVVGGYGWASGGWPGRIPAAAEQVAAVAATRKADPEKCFNLGDGPNKFCRFGGPPGGKLDLVLWGDSHAWAIAPALKAYAEGKGLALGLVLRGDCAPLIGVWRSKDQARRVCRRFNDEALAHIRASGARVVLIAARWAVYTEGPQVFIDDTRAAKNRAESRAILEAALARTLDGLADHSVVILEQVPQNRGDLPSASLVLYRLGQPLDRVAPLRAEHDKQQKAMRGMLDRAAATHAVSRIDPAAALCRAEVCTVAAGGELLYFDDDHLSLAGSRYLLPFLEAGLDKVLASGAPAKP